MIKSVKLEPEELAQEESLVKRMKTEKAKQKPQPMIIRRPAAVKAVK